MRRPVSSSSSTSAAGPAMYEAGLIKPHVARTFPFSEAPLAHHHLHDRMAKGKVLLVPD